jgi:type II secretory pathway component PulF
MSKFLESFKKSMPSLSRLFVRSKKEHHPHHSSHTPHAPHAPHKKHSKKAKPLLLHFSVQEQAVFSKRLAMILRSGMPIMQGLHMMGSQAKSGSASYIYNELTTHVEHGQSLSSGMQKFANIFGDFAINVVRVGESSGTLHLTIWRKNSRKSGL